MTVPRQRPDTASDAPSSALDFEYDLFISYVRRDVTRVLGQTRFDVVAELKRTLEQHRRPKLPAGDSRRFRVCTDLDDFDVDGTFDSVMHARIGSSRGFLLIATPGVVRSDYVRRELAIARTYSHLRTMAAVLTARPADVAPDLFAPEDVAADLAAADGTTRGEWRQLLLRESHKIVARTWQLKLRDVHDRFEAERRHVRKQIASAIVAVVVLAIALVVGMSGELGFHRVAILTLAHQVVSPDGLGFSDDGRTPVLIKDRAALVWTNGIDNPPASFALPFSVLHSIDAGAGVMAVSGLDEAGRIELPAAKITHRLRTRSSPEAIALMGHKLIVTTGEGEAFEIDDSGASRSLPRPISVTGRRFPAFREKGPFVYGDLLAVGGDRFLASATSTGRLALLDRKDDRFIVAAEPQFPLAEPVEGGADPVLYETENTRPIAAMAFLPDLSLLFSEGAGLRRVDTLTGRVVPLTHCPIGLVRQFLILPDGRTILAVTTSTLEVLRLARDRFDRIDCLQRTTLEPNSIPRAALSRDGRTVLVAYFDGSPELWRRTYRVFGSDLWEPR